MKAIEDAALPFIEPMMFERTCILTPDQQCAVAKWAVLKVMVFEHVSTKNPIYFTDRDRSGLKEHGTIPDDTAVWLSMAQGIDTFYTRADPVENGEILHGHVATMAYRRFVAQVASMKLHVPTEPGKITIVADSLWRDTLVRVWPPQALAAWPTSASIAAGAIDAFHHRFSAPGAGESH